MRVIREKHFILGYMAKSKRGKSVKEERDEPRTFTEGQRKGSVWEKMEKVGEKRGDEDRECGGGTL